MSEQNSWLEFALVLVQEMTPLQRQYVRALIRAERLRRKVVAAEQAAAS